MLVSRKDAKCAKKNFFGCFACFAPLREILRVRPIFSHVLRERTPARHSDAGRSA